MSSKLGAGLTSKKAYYMAQISEVVRREGWNPRFDFGDMESMIGSVIAVGVKNPIWVKRNDQGKLAIVDGDRRFTAVERANERGAKITEIPVRILDKDTDDAEALILALTANEAKPLTPLEEASAYKRLIESTKCSANDLAKRLGRSEAHVKDRLSLLGASPAVKDAVSTGAVGSTLAENIVAHTKDHAEQTSLVQKAAESKEGKKEVQEKIRQPRRPRQPQEVSTTPSGTDTSWTDNLGKPIGEAPQVSAPTSKELDAKLQDLEMGQLADLTVLAQRYGFSVAGGMLTDEELEVLAGASPAADAQLGQNLRDMMLVMFRLGSVMALRAARGKKFNLLP